MKVCGLCSCLVTPNSVNQLDHDLVLLAALEELQLVVGLLDLVPVVGLALLLLGDLVGD